MGGEDQQQRVEKINEIFTRVTGLVRRPPCPDRTERARKHLRQLQEEKARGLRRDHRALTAWPEAQGASHDIARLLNHLRSDAERVAAAERLALGPFRTPVHRRRFPQIVRCLESLFEHERDDPEKPGWEDRFREIVQGGLFVAVQELGRYLRRSLAGRAHAASSPLPSTES